VNVVPWFEITAQANFDKFLRTPPSAILQLGCFAGDATAWLLERFPLAALTDVDTFCGSDEHDGIDMAAVEALYRARFADEWRLETLVGRTVDIVPKMGGRWFDFVYIDADHHAAAVLMDGLMAWPLVAPGGILCFDDYTWGAHTDLGRLERPYSGICAFMDLYRSEFTVLAMNTQVWLHKHQEKEEA
jgi:predicted O-methyltransferase YrrM